MITVIAAVLSFLRGFFLPKNNLALENAALRQQLAVFQRQGKRPKLTRTDRAFWMVLRKLWRNWARVLVIVKPETVNGWSRQGFRHFWRQKSKPGRRRIPRKHIDFIRRISHDHLVHQHHPTLHGPSRQGSSWWADLADIRQKSRQAGMGVRFPDPAHRFLLSRIHLCRDGNWVTANRPLERDNVSYPRVGQATSP